MSKKITIVALVAMALVFASFTIEDEPKQTQTISNSCTSSETKKKCKGLLDPYSYDASKTTTVTFKNKPQIKELEIPLYLGEKYKFVFSKEGLPQNVDIKVYDHKFEAKHRNLLFSSKDFPDDQMELEWIPEKSRKMYIDYEVPPTNDTIKKGCLVLVLGYKAKKDK